MLIPVIDVSLWQVPKLWLCYERSAYKSQPVLPAYSQAILTITQLHYYFHVLKYAMNFTFFVAVFAAVLAVGAAPTAETNAQRLARGLPPLAPVQKRGSPSAGQY